MTAARLLTIFSTAALGLGSLGIQLIMLSNAEAQEERGDPIIIPEKREHFAEVEAETRVQTEELMLNMVYPRLESGAPFAMGLWNRRYSPETGSKWIPGTASPPPEPEIPEAQPEDTTPANATGEPTGAGDLDTTGVDEDDLPEDTTVEVVEGEEGDGSEYEDVTGDYSGYNAATGAVELCPGDTMNSCEYNGQPMSQGPPSAEGGQTWELPEGASSGIVMCSGSSGTRMFGVSDPSSDQEGVCGPPEE